MNWQKKARLGIAIFGVAVATGVFFAVGEREKPIVAPVPVRLDPKAKVESTGAVLQQVRGTKQDFQIEADRQLTYEGGTTKFVGIRITLRERAGRDFIISANEAQAGEDRKRLDLNGDVKLASSDGFEATTDSGSFTEADGFVRAPGPVSFRKGRMSGSGIGMSYNEDNDVLTISRQSHVKLTGADGGLVMEFTAAAATLARRDNYLLLEGAVHALRGEQALDADKATARLTENDEQITYIELRGNSRVAGGSGTFDSMTARDIDLDYTDDGKVLERLMLNGGGAISLLDQSGAPGRQIRGDALDLTIAPDGALTRAIGRENVQLDLPAATGLPARRVRARTLDGVGEAGKGLTAARFADDVEYREEPQKGAGRIARSRALRVALLQDVISEAVFSGAVKFEEEDLRASAAEARYQPDKGALRLLGADAGGGPRVADDAVTIEAESIDVVLNGPKMSARGKVKTLMQPGRKGGSKMPGLFQQEQPATAAAASLEYDGESKRAIYTGNAALWQGQTAVRAETISLDQQKGDLLASGAARSTITIDNALSVGRGEEIRYDDAARVITYRDPRTDTDTTRQSAPAAPVPVPGSPSTISQLSGPQGDLRASRIIVTLAKADTQVERLDASGHVTLRLDQRLVTGSQMTYFARDERYVMSGAPAMPVKIVDECRETIGRTLTFFKSTDRIIVDGNEEIRTQTKSGGPCQPRPE
jgi:LPS export ABC transporter protein LptC